MSFHDTCHRITSPLPNLVCPKVSLLLRSPKSQPALPCCSLAWPANGFARMTFASQETLYRPRTPLCLPVRVRSILQRPSAASTPTLLTRMALPVFQMVCSASNASEIRCNGIKWRCRADSIVRLWDLRRMNEPLLAFSDADAWEERRSTTLSSICFSPTTQDLLMTTSLAAAEDRPRFWTLSTQQSLHKHDAPADRRVLRESQGHSSTRPPASVAFVNLPHLQSKSSTVAVSKDGLLEFADAPQTHHLAWTIDNQMAALSQSVGVFGPKAQHAAQHAAQLDDEGNTFDKDVACSMKSRLAAGYSADVGVF